MYKNLDNRKIVNFSSIERTSKKIGKKGGAKKREYNITKESDRSKSINK